MPLSEEELRLLEQMERALIQDDPKLASTLRGTSLRRSAHRRAILAGVVFAVGVALLMTGVIVQLPVVGILGFVVMLGSATFGLAALRNRSLSNKPSAAFGSSHPSHGFTVHEGGRRGKLLRRQRGVRGSFMARMEERWRRRRDENNGW
ncbi:DUF3040 domain-containing protein [Nocardioides sp.]|uniref:DUF3040 domain-containing protein n=1 Tax=Nocardioides sp. TaxID=35761 RepID=UPI0039E330A1